MLPNIFIISFFNAVPLETEEIPVLAAVDVELLETVEV